MICRKWCLQSQKIRSKITLLLTARRCQFLMQYQKGPHLAFYDSNLFSYYLNYKWLSSINANVLCNIIQIIFKYSNIYQNIKRLTIRFKSAFLSVCLDIAKKINLFKFNLACAYVFKYMIYTYLDIISFICKDLCYINQQTTLRLI